jgi:hypothetical protein
MRANKRTNGGGKGMGETVCAREVGSDVSSDVLRR